MMNRKLITGFPTSYRWTVYVVPKFPQRVAQKSTCVCVSKIKFNFNRIKSATFFLYVKTSSGKVAI